VIFLPFPAGDACGALGLVGALAVLAFS